MPKSKSNKKPYDPRVTGPDVKCFFFAVVIRKEAIEQKFKGGFKRFLEEHADAISYNDHLVTHCAMSTYDVDYFIDPLIRGGLQPDHDFFQFNTPSRLTGETDIGCRWFRLRPVGKGVYAFYVG